MPLLTLAAGDVLGRLDTFSTIVDARSPAEHALDRLPGAVNWPSLGDDERASIGTEYTQVSPFAARKRGAMLVARNVAGHIERHVLDKAKDWQPLVYCWRGGQRSEALAATLASIGFRVHKLEGGYQAFRRAVVAALATLPQRLELRVICAPTGSGKSRLLRAMAAAGAQTLDLEAIALHRGSVLGLEPGGTQPTQKRFDTLLWEALRRLDPARPVWVESESRKIGDLRLPEALVERMRAAPCRWLEVPTAARVALLLADYDHLVRDAEAFCARLDALVPLRGRAVVGRWQALARAGDPAVVQALLDEHYDPIYRRSLARNFGDAVAGASVEWDGSDAGLRALAQRLIDDR